jgi:hypothetical protein
MYTAADDALEYQSILMELTITTGRAFKALPGSENGREI